MRGKQWIYVVMLVCCFFLSPTGWAANDTKITVEAGYGGVARPGDIMSVYVTVESSRFVSGEVQVEYGGNKMSHSLAKEAGTKQSVSFSMPVLPNVQEVRVQFLDAQTQRQQEEKAFIRLLPAETIIVGLISEAPEQLGYISEMKLPFPDTYNIVPVPLSLSSIDREVAAMDSLPFIILDRVPGAMLTSSQQSAIQTWIERGGMLLNGLHSPLFPSLTAPQAIGKGYVIPMQQELASPTALLTMEQEIHTHIKPVLLSRVLQGQQITNRASVLGDMQSVAARLLQPAYKLGVAIVIVLAIYVLCIAGSIRIYRHVRWYTAIFITGGSLLFLLWGAVEGMYGSRQVAARIVVHGAGETAHEWVAIYPQQAKQLTVQLPDADWIADMGRTATKVDGMEKLLSYQSDGPHLLYNQSSKADKGNTSEAFVLKVEANTVTGTIQNPRIDSLQHSFLLIGDTVIPTREVEGKERLRIEYRLNHALRHMGDYERTEYIKRVVPLTNSEQALYDTYVTALRASGWDALWFGFVKEERQVELNGKKQHMLTHTLHVYPLSLDSASYPSGVISPVVYNGPDTPTAYEQEIGRDKPVVWYYSAPALPPQTRFAIQTKDEADAISYQIYNYESTAWENVQSDWTLLAPYVRNGPLMVKANGEGRVFTPSIEIGEERKR